MLYIFLDETYGNLPEGRRFVIGCIIVQQSRWNDLFADGRDLELPGKSSRADRVNTYLGRLGGLGVLTFSNIPSAHVGNGEIDGTKDIPQMSRGNNLWSHCFAFGIARTLISVLLRGDCFSRVDVYYDPMSLKESHREALEGPRGLRDLFGKIMEEYCRCRNVNRGRPVQIGKIQQVSKAAPGTSANKLQVGTGLAHRLCRITKNVLQERSRFNHIEIHNNTDAVNGVMQQYY